MKFLLIAVAFTCAVVTVTSDFLDEYDFEPLINNEEEFKAAFSCVVEQGPCDDKYLQLKEKLPKLIESQCSECNPEQKAKFDKISKMIAEKYPKEFEDVTKKFSKKE